MISEGQAAICATPGVVVSTTEKAMAVPGDFGHFLKPGPFLTSEEADNMDGIGTIRIRLEEVQDQVNSNTTMHTHFIKKIFAYHIFQKAQVTLNKNAHNLQHHFGAQFFMLFHMV